MFGKDAATAFEVEAERRREVIESERWTTPTGRGLTWLAATLLARVLQRT